MKRILSLILLSFMLLQSCSQNEFFDETPKQVVTPVDVKIENAAKDIGKFLTGGAKAILLKPVDEDPNTHLTTLFYADNTGNIKPLVENFEVKQVEVTKSGVYILTNYKKPRQPGPPDYIFGTTNEIAFFVKYDMSWIQMAITPLWPNIDAPVEFIMSDSETGDILFRNDSVLRTNTLTMDNTYRTGIDVEKHSGNIALFTVPRTANKLLANPFTHEGHLISNTFEKIASLHNNTMVAVFSPYSQTVEVVHMNSGATSWFDPATINMPTDMVGNESGTGIITLGSPYFHKGNSNGESEFEPNDVIVSQVEISSSAKPGDAIGGMPSQIKWDGSDITPTPPGLNELRSTLDILINYKIVGNQVYYSGRRSGKPISGIYDIVAKKDLFIVQDSFTSINPL